MTVPSSRQRPDRRAGVAALVLLASSLPFTAIADPGRSQRAAFCHGLACPPTVASHPTGDGGVGWVRRKYEPFSSSHHLEEVDGSEADRELISKAYHYAQKAQESRSCASNGESFDRSVGVAEIIAGTINLDAASIAAGLLCPLIDDTSATETATAESMKDEFGAEIAALVGSVAEIRKITYESSARNPQGQAENYRRMVLATVRDVRAVLVRLAEWTHNIRTLVECISVNGGEKEDEQRSAAAAAKETLDLWAPLAHRLGIFKLKIELEDASLRLLYPEVYAEIESMMVAKQVRRQAYTEEVISVIDEAMKKAGLSNASVSGRAKHLYSVYNKMQSKGKTFDEIQDLTAFRVIVDDITQCYQALGSVHGLWAPIPKRFKDYVALPKANGYQSLHTTVVGPRGWHIEVQIRTREMHCTAEEGIAAHWIYKDGSGGRKERGSSSGGQSRDAETESRRFSLLRQLVEWVRQPNDEDGEGGGPLVREKLFENEVFIFSPTGQLFSIKRGATVLDFAYRIHTHLGHHCVGARINGRMAPLKYAVENGDVVEVLTSSQQTPQRDWLNIVMTSRARARIGAWVKSQQREENISVGRDLFDKELRKRSRKGKVASSNSKEFKRNMQRVCVAYTKSDEDHLFASIGQGSVAVSSAVDSFLADTIQKESQSSSPDEGQTGKQGGEVEGKKKAESSAVRDGILVGGERNFLVGFCQHCNPLRGEAIGGVITRGRGIKVHRSDCQYMINSDTERRIKVTWDPSTAGRAKPRPVRVDVVCEDLMGMLANMSKAISSLGVNIHSVDLRSMSSGHGRAQFELMLSDLDGLERVSRQLRMEHGVISVERG